jgi:ABC-2 type transport system permease protein
MMQTQVALLRRELWEHRSIFVVPGVVALFVALSSLLGQVTISDLEHVDLGIIGATNMPENARGVLINLVLFTISNFFGIAMWFLMVFYTLDSLYAERKDRSILFWRSIPVTDFETVLSKLLTAIVVIPLVTFAIAILTHLVVLGSLSVWVGDRGGSPANLIWSAAPLLDAWSATLVMALAVPLWLSPFIGWFLFVSAFTKRSPLLIAALPVFLLPLFEQIFFRSSLFADAFFVRTVQMPLFAGVDRLKALADQGADLESLAEADLRLVNLMDLGGFLADPRLWLGIVVCALFTAAAVYVRRYRDES